MSDFSPPDQPDPSPDPPPAPISELPRLAACADRAEARLLAWLDKNEDPSIGEINSAAQALWRLTAVRKTLRVLAETTPKNQSTNQAGEETDEDEGPRRVWIPLMLRRLYDENGDRIPGLEKNADERAYCDWDQPYMKGYPWGDLKPTHEYLDFRYRNWEARERGEDIPPDITHDDYEELERNSDLFPDSEDVEGQKLWDSMQPDPFNLPRFKSYVPKSQSPTPQDSPHTASVPTCRAIPSRLSDQIEQVTGQIADQFSESADPPNSLQPSPPPEASPVSNSSHTSSDFRSVHSSHPSTLRFSTPPTPFDSG